MNVEIGLVLIGVGVSLGFLLILKQLKDLQDSKKDSESFRILTEWLRGMQVSLDKNTTFTQKQLADSSKELNERLDRAATVIGAVQKEIGHMSEIGRSMKDLQEFLRSPKLRGNLGEQVLRELLGQFLPKESFNLQYRFRSGEIVDAAIRTEAGLVAIDSKFPMENFRKMISAESESEKNIFQKDFGRDVKKHIDAIADKYILPEEGTIDYALMYVPSEAVYYEITANMNEITDYSHQKRVLPVSPSTFYAYLRSILLSFEGKKIEEKAKQILDLLKGLKGDSDKFGQSLRVLTKHINEAKNASDLVNTRYQSLDSKLGTIRSLKTSQAVENEEKLPIDE